MLNGETAKQVDARIEALWQTLDASKKGYLDLSGLKKGLSKMDHPLKYADSLLRDVLSTIDTNRDGRISYTEFRTFVKQTEQELWTLFNRIDRNNDGTLDKEELAAAFQGSGVAVSRARLDRFFARVDANDDGSVSFEEWRDFLLFIPSTEPNLKEVLSYFSASLKLSPEGDVQISDDTIQGIGTILHFVSPFFDTFTTAVTSIYRPQRAPPRDHVQSSSLNTHFIPFEEMLGGDEDPKLGTASAKKQKDQEDELLLISVIPHSGYFISGGVAGIVSRTTTAPLDRLKVYLIAQTTTREQTIRAAKSGSPFAALAGAYRTCAFAMGELWAAGGIRSLFAGNGLNIVKVMPESAIKFGSFEIIKRLEGRAGIKEESDAAHFVGGGIAGMIAQFSIYPLDTLKFRMQCETVANGLHGNALIIQTARRMWAQNGAVAFYRGLPMGLIGIFPYAAIDMGTFEYLKRRIATRNARLRGCHEDDAQPGSFATACVGGFSGALGASLVYPLNLLRTRLQSQGTVLHPRTYTGIGDVFRQTLAGEGVRGLFKGLTPNLLKVVPAVSITWVVYENCKKQMNLH